MKNTHATIHYAGNEFFVGITPSGHALTLDTNGVRSAAPSPLELLLVSLGACTATDVIAVLHKKREQVTDYRIEVHGDRREDFPKSFRRMEVRHVLKGHNLSEAAVAKAIELSTNKYCSVAATLRPTAEIVTSYELQEDSGAAAPPVAKEST
jgi:putative redox protein